MRTLTLPEVVISGVGIILGAGIYAIIGEAAALSGNALWLSFLLSALIALFSGLSYMELSSLFPEASAEYEYTRRSFGNNVAFVVGILVILSGVVGASTVAMGFAGYFTAFTGMPLTLSAILLILAMSFVLFYGIRQSALVAIIFTLIEAGGLVGIIIIGFPYLGSVDYMLMPKGFSGIMLGAALVFFAYQGFEEIVKLSDETVNPVKNIPTSVILALIITTTLYIAVSVSIVSIGGWELIAGSPNPFASVVSGIMPVGYTLFTAIALFATANTVLLMMLASSRIMYGMARKGHLPAVLAFVHKNRRTPAVAIVVVAVLSILFLSMGNIRDVALITNFMLFSTFAVINAAVIVLRFSMPDAIRPFRVPLNIHGVPVSAFLGIYTCIFFLLYLDPIVLLIGIVVIILAAAGNILFERHKNRIKS